MSNAFKFLAIYLTVILLLVLGVKAYAADSFEVAWDAPTQREDGSELALEDIVQFTVYTSVDGGEPTTQELPPDTRLLPQTITAAGNYCYQLTVTDSGGLTSAKSNEVCKRIYSASAPKPVILRLIVQ